MILQYHQNKENCNLCKHNNCNDPNCGQSIESRIAKTTNNTIKIIPPTSRERIQYYLDQCNIHKLSYLLNNDTLSIQDNGIKYYVNHVYQQM